MAELAIKGHPSRGKEVIKLLEMLGGVNKHKIDAIRQNYVYFIGMNNIIELLQINQFRPQQYIVYSLEEFEEKFPYKVGDNVACYVGLILEKEIHKIIEMEWDYDKCRIRYHLDNCYVIDVRDILYSVEYKTEQSKQEKIKDNDNLTITNEEAEKYMIKIPEIPQSINLSQLNLNEIEVVLGDYEFVLKNGKTYFVKKKPQYPKTYDDCCDVLNIETNRIIEYDECLGYRDITQYDTNLLTQLKYIRKLFICRDAYWKIAGEKMGLGKPWKPNWDDENEFKYSLYYFRNRIIYDYSFINSTILAFPTEEMRDEFYENFKDLIEECKELL